MPACNNNTTSTSNTTCVVLEITTPLSVSVPGNQSPMISDEVRLKLEMVFQITLFTVTSVFGIMSNIVNITVYWKQGIKDSITTSLFALSISDFFVVFFPLFTAGGYIADHFYPNSPIMFKAVAGVSATQLRHLFYSLSCSLTAFMSIERCMCVIKPFKVKLIFTRKRTIIVIFCLVSFYILGFIPLFTTQTLRWQIVPRRNYSRILTLWYHPLTVYVHAYHNSVMTILIPTAAQVIVTCTATIMINGLIKASEFRQMATRAKQQREDDNNKGLTTTTNSKDATQNGTTTTTTAGAGGGGGAGAENAGKDSGKEVMDSRDARLVKTMVILVVILSVANVPYIAMEYTEQIVPEMNPRKRYQNTFRLITSINFLLGSINASVNVFVYYYTGSRYKKIIRSMLCGEKIK